MDSFGNGLIVALVLLEIFQLVLFWMLLSRRYQFPLRQVRRLTTQLAEGRQPSSYYINGSPTVSGITLNLEKLGVRLDELQKRQQEEDFNLNVLLENMVEGVIVVDRGHVVRLVNDELIKLFDLKISPLNRTLLEALREAQVEMIVRETFSKNEAQRKDVALQSTSAQATRHFEVSSVPIRTKAGAADGAVLVFHDITRIKHLEVVRSEFVANVSHELRTPLAIFRGYLETLMEHPELPAEESKRMLEAMRRHSERLNALVEDLLVLTRFESKQIQIEFSIIRLDAFLRQLLHDWEQQIGSGKAEVELNLPESLPSIEVDPLRFEQVILNLLENAVAYSNPPRHITISVSCEGGQLELRVSDNGIGIPPADMPHIFERFYRVDKGRSRVSGGTGLGLSIVKHMIQAHHGSVQVQSEPGKGTTIILRLPVQQQPFSSQPLPRIKGP
jgi:two-component system phosphate regulon sensor histidine kinase PhoR